MRVHGSCEPGVRSRRRGLRARLRRTGRARCRGRRPSERAAGRRSLGRARRSGGRIALGAGHHFPRLLGLEAARGHMRARPRRPRRARPGRAGRPVLARVRAGREGGDARPPPARPPDGDSRPLRAAAAGGAPRLGPRDGLLAAAPPLWEPGTGARRGSRLLRPPRRRGRPPRRRPQRSAASSRRRSPARGASTSTSAWAPASRHGRRGWSTPAAPGGSRSATTRAAGSRPPSTTRRGCSTWTSSTRPPTGPPRSPR